MPDNKVEPAENSPPEATGPVVSGAVAIDVDESGTVQLSPGPCPTRAALFLQVEKIFHDYSDDGQTIDFHTFGRIFGSGMDFYAKRVFQLIDQDKSSTLDFMEYMAAATRLVCGNTKERVKFFFELCDLDDSGEISKDEFKAILWESATEATLRLRDGVLDDLTSAFFGPDSGDSTEQLLTYEHFSSMLMEYPEMMKMLDSCIKTCLFPSSTEKRVKESKLKQICNSKTLKNNAPKIVFLAVFLIINLGLFLKSAIVYSHENGFVILARGSGMTLNFNCALLLLLVCRKLFSTLHSTHVTEFLPIDQHILYHKMVAILVVFFSFTHAIGHFCNFKLLTEERKEFAYWEYLFTIRPKIGWVYGTASPTGLALLLVLIVIFICSTPFVRHRGLFQVFYWTHQLYVVFLLLLILHAPIFWMFLLLPLLIFVADKVSRRSIKAVIKRVRVHPSKASKIIIDRPEGFTFRPGDYCEINIPSVASFEWHPFSISSAPENQDEITFHILVRGDWTRKVHAFCAARQRLSRRLTEFYETMVNVETGPSGSIDKYSVAVKKAQQKNAMCSGVHDVVLPCLLQGPIGTGARGVFRTEHAVLVGTGIGVTPFASILRSAMWRFRSIKTTCPNCDMKWLGEITKEFKPLRKLDFIWITRGQQSFDWFLDLLAEVEEEQQEAAFRDFLTLHIHMTGSLAMRDLKATVLRLGLDAVHRHMGHDLLTGLRTKTTPGRPNWEKLFTRIRDENRGKVKVFVCGSPQLASAIKKKCNEFHFGFAKEFFDS